MSEEGRQKVVNLLEAACRAAAEMDMSPQELAGLLFFYAHNVAQEVREAALSEVPPEGG